MRYEIKPGVEDPLFEFLAQLDAVGVVPYSVQEEAMLAWAASDGGVFISVPTGSGKTLIAEAAIFEALCNGQRAYYTTPLVALTEQKFREFRDRFGEDNVGMITGNKKVNPDAPLIVAVTEILTNRLLVPVDPNARRVCDVVVFDEFHYFNDYDRGWVWETAVLLLPPEIKLLMLSATVEKTVPFVAWLKVRRGREFTLIRSDDRRVPLTYIWCEELLTDAVELLIEHLRAPALIFAFDREGCYTTAQSLLSLPTGRLLSDADQQELQSRLKEVDFNRGAGQRFRKLLNKGIGVHHAGVLPKWRHLVEELFEQKLLKFVVCTETLAAGINLPARTVVIPELVKYSGGAKKAILDPATGHQIFGRAGRPQFDDQGFVYVLAPEDEVKMKKWEERLLKLGRAPTKADLNKKPKRDEKMVRWNKDQFIKLTKADPPPLEAHSLLPYGALVFLLQEHDVATMVELVNKKFATPTTIQNAHNRLRGMLANLEALEYIATEPGEDEDGKPVPMIKRVKLDDVIIKTLATDFENLLDFRGVNPLFGHWLSQRLKIATLGEKLNVLESLVPVPKNQSGPWFDFDEEERGPLDALCREEIGAHLKKEEDRLMAEGAFEGKEPDMVRQQHFEPVPPFLAGKLLWLFNTLIPAREDIRLQSKEVARNIALRGHGFFDFIEANHMATQEGGVYRYLLRLVLLARQFGKLAGADDPELAKDYHEIEYAILSALEPIDPSYIDEWKSEHGVPE